MQYIRKLKLFNFRKFEEFEVDFNAETNTLIGDNESGKSSILQAIELVASGSRNRVENIGIESIINKDSVSKFLSGEKEFSNLPEVHVEVYLGDDRNPDLVGRHNSDEASVAGLHMMCNPNDDLTSEINDAISEDNDTFPFEYYVVRFFTFSPDFS